MTLVEIEAAKEFRNETFFYIVCTPEEFVGSH
jgi:hypothetical protein